MNQLIKDEAHEQGVMGEVEGAGSRSLAIPEVSTFLFLAAGSSQIDLVAAGECRISFILEIP